MNQSIVTDGKERTMLVNMFLTIVNDLSGSVGGDGRSSSKESYNCDRGLRSHAVAMRCIVFADGISM